MLGIKPAGISPVNLLAVSLDQAGSDYYRSLSLTNGIVNNKTLTGSVWVNVPNVTNRKTIYNLRTSNRAPLLFVVNTNRTVRVFSNGSPSLNTTVIDATTTSGVIANDNEWYHIVFSVDMSDTSKREIYINGSSVAVTWTTYSNQNLNLLSCDRVAIAANAEQGIVESDVKLSQIWIDNSYIDLSTNISKFYSAGPVDMGTAGTESGLSEPLIYHNGDTDSSPTFQAQSGRTGTLDYTFTVNGTPTDTTGPL